MIVDNCWALTVEINLEPYIKLIKTNSGCRKPVVIHAFESSCMGRSYMNIFHTFIIFVLLPSNDCNLASHV